MIKAYRLYVSCPGDIQPIIIILNSIIKQRWQYQGPGGTTALAVVAPVWNIIYTLGLLVGIGGSVIFSAKRGGNDKSGGGENQYFTSAVIGALVLSVPAWIGIIYFERPILTFFGADESLLTLAHSYIYPIKLVFPLFLFNQMLAAFLRNDKNPGLATIGVLPGSIFNIFGDYFFVFTCDMGIFGAGLATAIGACVSFFVILSHFVSKKNTLRLVKTKRLFGKLYEICITGFSTFFIDVAMGILTVLFNRQIMKYLNADALAIYGPIIQVSTFIQCCAYSVGQAAQPIISTNFGAGKGGKIMETLRLALWTTMFFGVFWTAISIICPNTYIRIFMVSTPEILEMAPVIIRTYSVSFLLLPFNIFSTYYFQAIMKPKAAFIVSVARGLVASGILISVLPLLFGATFIDPKTGGIGALGDIGCYSLDMVLNAIGYPKPLTVSGYKSGFFGKRSNTYPEHPEYANIFGVDDFAAAFVRLEGDIILDFRISWAMNMDTTGDTLIPGTEADLRIPSTTSWNGSTGGSMKIYRNIAGEQVETVIPILPPNEKGNFYEKIRSFLDAVKEGGKAPVPTSQIIYNQAIIDGILKSSDAGCEIKIEIPEY